MDSDTFDGMTRHVGKMFSRRQVVGVIGALFLGSLGPARHEEASARKKKHHHKKTCRACGPCQDCVHFRCVNRCGPCDRCENNSCIASMPCGDTPCCAAELICGAGQTCCRAVCPNGGCGTYRDTCDGQPLDCGACGVGEACSNLDSGGLCTCAGASAGGVHAAITGVCD